MCGVGVDVLASAAGGGSTTTQGITSPTAPPRQATATPPSTAAATLTPNGPPQIGAPLARFISTYGQPFGHGGGGSDNFYADKGQTTILGVTFNQTTVTQIAVLGPLSWTNDQTLAACVQFLPSDATEFNRDGQYIDYHSSVGEVVIQNAGQGTCVLSLAQS